MNSPLSSQTFRWIGWAICFLIVFVAAFSLSGMQSPPLELDPSWHAALEFAVTHHYQFGTQIVFTFGPLGFLGARTSLGHLLGARIAFTVFWSALIALAATGMARRLTGWARYAFFAWLVVFMLSEGLDQTAFFVMAYGACLLLKTDPAQRRQIPLFVLGIVLLSLIKFTFLAAAAVSITLVSVCWATKQKVGQAVAMLVGASTAFVACWMAVGQSPKHLTAWLRHGLELSSGYSSAMNLVPKTNVLFAGLSSVAVFAAAWTIAASRARRNLENVAILVTLAQYAFLAWKEGFTRSGDWHAFIFFWFLPVGVVLCSLVDAKLACDVSAGRILGGALAATFALSLTAAHFQIPGFAFHLIVDWPHRMQRNAAAILDTVRGHGPDLFTERSKPGRSRMLLLDRARALIGGESVDVMNYLALAPVINGLNYRPRPVFQGFVAYTPALQNLNADYFRSEARPRYVLLCQQATDGRFPTLEDSAAFNYVLNNYVPVGRDGAFLVLQQRRAESIAFHVVHEQVLRFGEQLDLTPWRGAPLFVSVSISPSLWGRTATFLYQQQPVYMRLSTQGFVRSYRVVPSMAVQPFLLSPVLSSNYDVLNLYTSLPGVEPESITIDRPSRGSFEFQDAITLRLYTAPEFLRAARMNSPDNILADVQGRVFEPRPSLVESACGAQVTMFGGAPAWRVCAPSKVVLDIPPKSARFSGVLGVPEEAFLSSGGTGGVTMAIDVCAATGRCQRRFERFLQPPAPPADRGPISFRVQIEKRSDRILVLSTSRSQRASHDAAVAVWSQCRFEQTPQATGAP